MTGTETIIGIDVSKAYLDLWVRPGGRAWRCDYGEAELSEVVLEPRCGLRQGRCPTRACGSCGRW